MFSAPTWLRDLGFASWLLAGFILIIVGLVWLLGQTSTIVLPVILALVLGAVAGPIVDALEHRGLPRAAGAGLVLLGLVLIAALVFALIVHGISAHSADISTKASQGLDKVEGWLKDLGVDDTKDAKETLKKDLPQIRETLTSGVAAGVNGLTSVAFFLAFATLGTFFVLKDAPVMARFVNTHMGLPVRVASTVTSEVATALRNYFTGVTIIAAFNGILVGVIIFLANGAFQNILQPFVFGATLSLNPLVVLVVTIGAGALFGMVGLTLAAPLTSAAVHISGRLRQEGEWDRAPSGPEPSPEPVGA